MTSFFVAAFYLLLTSISCQAALTELDEFSVKSKNVFFKKYNYIDTRNQMNILNLFDKYIPVFFITKLFIYLRFFKVLIIGFFSLSV